MEKEYITDEHGNIKRVILDYDTFKEFEPYLEDYLLGKLMQKEENEPEVDSAEARRMLV